jgi:hypothetical protein
MAGNKRPRKAYKPRAAINYFMRVDACVGPLLEWFDDVLVRGRTMVNAKNERCLVIDGGTLPVAEAIETMTDVAEHYHSQGHAPFAFDVLAKVGSQNKYGMLMNEADLRGAEAQLKGLRAALLKLKREDLAAVIRAAHIRVLMQKAVS